MSLQFQISRKMQQIEEYVKNPRFVGLLQFETSTVCNGACVFCHHKDMTRKGVATWTTIFEVIDTCVPFANTVCPFLMQEPLLEPRLCIILDNIKQVNPRVNTQIYTNMAKLPDNWKSLIDEQNLDTMIVSFYGPTRKLYKKYQPTFDWATTRGNIRKFMRYRKKSGWKKPFVKMHYIGLPDLLAEAKTFYKDWKGVVDAIGTTVYRTHELDDPCFNNAEDITAFEQNLYGKAAPRVPCSRIWGGFYVLFNGDVVPCSADYNGENVLGNIHDDTAFTIWNNDKVKAFRQLHIEGRYGEIPLWRYCNYWKYEMTEEWVTYWLCKNT